MKGDGWEHEEINNGKTEAYKKCEGIIERAIDEGTRLRIKGSNPDDADKKSYMDEPFVFCPTCGERLIGKV